MKNVFTTISLVLVLLLTGCSSEELNEPALEVNKDQLIDPIMDKTSEQYLLLVLEGENYNWVTTSLETDQIQHSSIPQGPADYALTAGAYVPSIRNPLELTWSGYSDETGVYGTAELQLVTPSYSFHIIMQAECVVANANEAVYGGWITQIISQSGDLPGFDVGWKFYFNVIDNNSVSVTEFDKISGTMIFASPKSPTLCFSYAPGHHIWSQSGYHNVLSPGFVMVSNHPE